MKIKQPLLNLCVLVMITVLTTTLVAQVTIGSTEAPNKGALLDLKDGGTYSNGETASKGLGMPRVNLINLTPTTPVALASSIGGTGSWNLTEHVGLAVYNANANGSICPGIYIWDGTSWVPIVKDFKPDITMTDADGNTYNAKWFSADPCDPTRGAYWTTSNLYSTKDGAGNPFPGGVRLNPAIFYPRILTVMTINSTSDFTDNVTYGESDQPITELNQSQPMAAFAKKFGLIYIQAQAMSACPSGWHLPADSDWRDLALAHGGADIAGAAMRVNTNYYYPINWEKSFKWGSNDTSGTVLSGFNALPSGYSYDGVRGNYFSNSAYWWSSTRGYFRYMYDYEQFLGEYTSEEDGLGYYYSVRCIKK